MARLLLALALLLGATGAAGAQGLGQGVGGGLSVTPTAGLPLTGGTVSGTLTLTGAGTALTVSNNASLNTALVTGTLSIGSTINLGTSVAANGNAAITTPNGSNIVLNPTGTARTQVNSVLRANTYFSIQGGLNTPAAWNGGSAEGVSAIYASAGNLTGTDNGVNPAAVFYYPIVSDARICTGGNLCPAMMLDYNMGDPGGLMRGGRNGLLVQVTQRNAITAQAGSAEQFVSGMFSIQSSFSAGGTDTANNSRGIFYGMNPQVVLHSGATNFTGVNAWGEGDLALEAGSSARDVGGRSLVLLASHAVAAARSNTADAIAAQQGAAATWTNGYTFGGLDGPWPMASTATLIGTIVQINCGGLSRSCYERPQLATAGVDWQNVNFSLQSGYGFRSPGFAVDGTGQGWFGGGLRLATVTTGYKIDVPNAQVVTSVVTGTAGQPIVSAGSSVNNYYPGDIVYGTGTPTPGQYQITDTTVVSAAITAGGSGGTNGAQTVTGTTGTGAKFQASVTVTGGVITAVNSISLAGDYTVNPTNLNAEPVTGASLTGATLAIGVGALTITPLVPDVFAACPGTITPTGGSGAGLTLTPTCSARNTVQLQPSGGALQTGSGTWTANATTAVSLTSIAPAGAHATVQEWLTVTDSAGTVRYIPAF